MALLDSLGLNFTTVKPICQFGSQVTERWLYLRFEVEIWLFLTVLGLKWRKDGSLGQPWSLIDHR